MAIKWTGAGGDNAATGDTRSERWRDLVNVNSGRAAGDEIRIVGPATYAGDNWVLNPTNSGTSGSKITLTAEPGQEIPEQYQYDGPLQMREENFKVAPIIIDGEGIRNVFQIGSVDHWRIKGIENRNAVSTACNASNKVGHELINVRLGDCGNHGVHMDGATDFLLEDVEIHDTITDAVKGSGGSGLVRCTIRKSYIHNIGDDMLAWYPQDTGADRGLVELNSFDHAFGTAAHEDGMVMRGATKIIIRNNIFSDASQLIYMSGGNGDEATFEDIWIHGNIFWSKDFLEDTEEGGDLIPIFIDSRSNRNDVIQRIYVFNNSFGVLGITSKAIHFLGDDQETTVANLFVRNNIYYDTRNDDDTKLATSTNSPYTAVSSFGYSCHYNLADSGETGSLEDTDPRFKGYVTLGARPYNFQLKSDSPCIGAGDPALTAIVPEISGGWNDMAGNFMPANGATMGALQFASRGRRSTERGMERGMRRR